MTGCLPNFHYALLAFTPALITGVLSYIPCTSSLICLVFQFLKEWNSDLEPLELAENTSQCCLLYILLVFKKIFYWNIVDL